MALPQAKPRPVLPQALPGQTILALLHVPIALWEDTPVLKFRQF